MGQTFTEEFITQNKEVEPYSSWRQASKAILFKLIYGGTYKSFAVERNIPEEEAKRIFDTFTTVIPGIADYMNNQEIMAKTYYNVDTLPGHVRSLKVYQFERYNSKARSIALNHPIQGTACYFVNIAMMKLHERLPEINGRILLTVHDSIASQVPDDKLEEGLALQKWCKIDYLMEKYKEFFYAPLRMSLYYGKNWHELTKKKGDFMIRIGNFYMCIRGKALQQVLDLFGCVKPTEFISKCNEVGLYGGYKTPSVLVINSYKGDAFQELQEFLKKVSPYINYGDGYYFLVGMDGVSFDAPIKIIF